MKVLITGVSGALGREVALTLDAAGHEVIGMDVRPWRDAPKTVSLHRVDLRKRAAEDVFRHFRPEAVIHMATVTAFVASGDERDRINLGGTRAVFEFARSHGAKHVVFVGRHTFYGASSDLPLFHREDEPPMGIASFPELADLVAADLFAGSEIWRYPELCTTVLRVCYTLGPRGHGTLAGYLRGRYVPTVLGFDPLFQFMHESDVANAIGATIKARPRGVFNVAGAPALPLSVIIKQTERKRIMLPEIAFEAMVGRFGLPTLPKGAVEHIKYPVIVDPKAFNDATNFVAQHNEVDTLRDFKQAFPVR